MNVKNDEKVKDWLNEAPDGSSSWSDYGDQSSGPPSVEDVSEIISDHSSLQKATILLLAVCVLGIGAIYLLKMRVKPKVATDEEKALEVQVDLALQKLSDQTEQQKHQELFNDTADMIQLFYDYPANQQVALKELQRDPFIRQTTSSPTQANEVVDDHKQEQLRKDLEKQLSSLKLQSVLQRSEGSKCLINGQIYQIGQMVGNTFIISLIEKNSVILTSSEMEFNLAM